jgi:Phage integrase family
VLPEDEIRALWGAWERMGYPFGTIQQLLLLTAQRRGEVSSLRWDQLDMERGVWRLASADTKTGREHVLPLSPPVLDILRQVPRFAGSALLFPANRHGSDRPVSGFSKAKRTTDRLSGIEGWTWHDLRRTAATGMARLNVSPHVCERILNHSGSGMMSSIARVWSFTSTTRTFSGRGAPMYRRGYRLECFGFRSPFRRIDDELTLKHYFCWHQRLKVDHNRYTPLAKVERTAVPIAGDTLQCLRARLTGASAPSSIPRILQNAGTWPCAAQAP